MVKMDYNDDRRYTIEINGRRIFEEVIDNSERITRVEERINALDSKMSLVMKLLTVLLSLEVSILIGLLTILIK